MGTDQPGNRERPMKIGTLSASTKCRAASMVIAFAMGLACAEAQTAKNAFPTDDVIVLTKSGPIPGPGPRALLHHVTTCDRFNSRPATNRQASSLSGCIRGAAKARGAIKVQIQSADVSKLLSTAANEFGEFSFGDVPGGDYSLLATQGAKVLAFRTIQIPLKMPLVMVITPHISGVDTLYLGEY
jgi:hypothetical protein